MSTVKFPGGAFFPGFGGAALEIPTRLSAIRGFLHGQEEQGLSLNMAGNVSPTLLETLDCLERNCQELGHFSLRFAKTPANHGKLFFVHNPPCHVEEKPFCQRTTLGIFKVSGWLNKNSVFNYMPQCGIRASFFTAGGLGLTKLSG